MELPGIRMKNGNLVPVSRKRRSQVQDAYLHFLQQAETKDAASAVRKTERLDGPWRILLVDDDPAERMVFADILQSHGCMVQMADNGEDALRLIAEGVFDCVLLDVMIPG